MSSDYENTFAADVHDDTPDHIRAYRCGYSGNGRAPQPDVLITTLNQNYALELKGPIQSERCYVEEDDLQQLVDCGNAVTKPRLVVKFSNRKPVVIRYIKKVMDGSKQWEKMSLAEKFATVAPPSFDANATPSGNLSVTKPSLDDWDSAKASAPDHIDVLNTLGVVTEVDE